MADTAGDTRRFAGLGAFLAHTFETNAEGNGSGRRVLFRLAIPKVANGE
jgi:hypothetical protein